MAPEKNSLNFIFPTKYVIPKSLKFSHWPSQFPTHLKNMRKSNWDHFCRDRCRISTKEPNLDLETITYPTVHGKFGKIHLSSSLCIFVPRRVSYLVHSRNLTKIQTKIPCLKGDTFSKPSFWVSMLVSG